MPALARLRRRDRLPVRVHPESQCVFPTAAAFYDVYSLSLPCPGVPVRTLRRPCACLPKTSASPGPPGGGGQPNVTWSLYRAARGGQEEANEGGGDGELNGTKLKKRYEDMRSLIIDSLSALDADFRPQLGLFQPHHLFDQRGWIKVTVDDFKSHVGGHLGAC